MSAASVKLSPALKALIAAPHARPAAIPAPSAPALKRLFDGIRERGERGGVGRETWLTVGSAAILTVNSPKSLNELWSYAADRANGLEEKARAAAVMREVGLKCISFNGIPRTINGLGALRAHLPEDVTAHLSTRAERLPSPENITATMERGKSLWDAIYEPHSAKLLARLADSHPDLPVHILNSHYGPLLGDPFGTSPSGGYKVGRVLTSVVAMTCLRAQQGVGPQVTSHVFGLKKALLEGGGAEGEEALQGQEWLCSDQGVQWVLESTDEISQVVGGGQTTFAGPVKRESKL